MSKAIKLAKYKPQTCLRVRCRDEVLGWVHPRFRDEPGGSLLIRDDRTGAWLNDDGTSVDPLQLLSEKTFGMDVVEVVKNVEHLIHYADAMLAERSRDRE